ncbi:MAG: His/Gly/Thr/Pro-type tRNA ligase C-terminal domain-containing protein, partial [Sphaerochaeta sp.]|nr:His/Gly/Thr/Pro-type tRNA ligase C-terminal domain-containing protein [Sphaerochaeta sp.]
YLLENKKIGAQFKYAEQQRIPYALICGSNEHDADKVTLKNLLDRENKQMISLEEAIETIRKGS